MSTLFYERSLHHIPEDHNFVTAARASKITQTFVMFISFIFISDIKFESTEA